MGKPMPRINRKSDLPQKMCVTCGKPFAWRKKWEREWPQVKYCSDKCRRKPDNRLPLGDTNAK